MLLKFLEACEIGDECFVLCMLNTREVNVHAHDCLGFRLACRYGHVKIVKLFLENLETNVASAQYDGFISAIKNRKYDVIEILLSLEGERKIPNYVIEQIIPEICGNSVYFA